MLYNELMASSDQHPNFQGSLTQALVTTALNCLEQFAVPAVDQVVMPDGMPDAGYKYSRFGLLSLADGSSGFFYRLLTPYSTDNLDTQRFEHSVEAPQIPLAQLVAGYASEHTATREIGMACINAVSQHMFARCGLDLCDERYSVRSYTESMPDEYRQVGMVGYFSPLVKRLQSIGTPLVVLELDRTLHQESRGLLVTDSIDALSGCDHIICTASTLLNHSLDRLLETLANRCFFELIGPTAGCLPDALFAHGVNAVGGSHVVALSGATERITAMEPWGNTVVKYVLTPENYPGLSALMSRYQPHSQP